MRLDRSGVGGEITGILELNNPHLEGEGFVRCRLEAD